jgi:hypothetical protein
MDTNNQHVASTKVESSNKTTSPLQIFSIGLGAALLVHGFVKLFLDGGFIGIGLGLIVGGCAVIFTVVVLDKTCAN